VSGIEFSCRDTDSIVQRSCPASKRAAHLHHTRRIGFPARHVGFEVEAVKRQWMTDGCGFGSCEQMQRANRKRLPAPRSPSHPAGMFVVTEAEACP
jgi:hypothetical protein